ncbi:MAG: D-2-hydroxyacid dehydrogenase [Acidimicrobiia bacterium]
MPGNHRSQSSCQDPPIAATVLVTAAQLDAFGDVFRQAAPDAHFLAMASDGTIRDGDVEVPWDEAAVEVAFGSTDLFERLGDDDTALRRFFGFVLRCDSLRWFQVAAAGVDAPVFGALLDRGVRLTTSHHTATPIAEYVLAQVLRARLPLDAMEADRRDGRWRHQEWDEIASSRWLVLGLGAIGEAVAVRARAFGASVTGVRRTPRGDEPVDQVIAMDDVPDALADHEVVVAALPSTAATAGLFDAELLGRLRPGSILVNVGRGSLVDEDALRRSLADDRPGTAILDVTGTEPLPEGHWLWDHPKVVLTSHTSSGGRQRVERAARLFAANLARWEAGEPLADEVTADQREAPSTG